MDVGLKFFFFFFNYKLFFFSARWHLSAGRTGQAKAMVNTSGLGQIKKNMNKPTIYMVMILNVEKKFIYDDCNVNC